jgi:hypothetical protein
MAAGIKTGGRQAGTPNRLTKEIRAVLKDFLFNELESLPDHLKALEPKERIEIIIKILPYILPKVNAVNYKENEPINFSGIWE